MKGLAALKQAGSLERTTLFEAIWSRSGLEPPQARTIAPDRIPAKPKALLVHDELMTTVLEAHYRTPVELRVLASFADGTMYSRRIALTAKRTAIPLLLAGARIDLTSLTPSLRTEIMEQQVPLGKIFRDAGVPFVSWPLRFLEVQPSPDVMALFCMKTAVPLFGRQTAALCNGKRIGDIIEILPPSP